MYVFQGSFPINLTSTMSSPDLATSPATGLKFVVVAPTFYSSKDETRYILGLEACRQAAKHGISLILIDASPSEDIKTGLENAGMLGASSSTPSGGHSFVKVVAQKSNGKKVCSRERRRDLIWNASEMISFTSGIAASRGVQ